MPKIIAFDLETTGLDTQNDRIVEFCLIELDDAFNQVSKWTERVNPGVPIPVEASQVHNILDADVADKPSFGEFAAKIQEVLADATLMSYNHRFDLDVMHAELVRNGLPGIPMDNPVIDPFHIFRMNLPHSLVGAVKFYLDENFEGAHSAEEDTLAMIRVLQAQIKKHGLPEKISENVFQPDRRFLDRGRKFYADAEGIIRFGFGRDFRDQDILDRVDILHWIMSKDFDEDTKNIVKKHLPFAQARLASKRASSSQD